MVSSTGALQMGMAEKAEPRFNECLKLTLPDLTNAEFQAVGLRWNHLFSSESRDPSGLPGADAGSDPDIRSSRWRFATTMSSMHKTRPAGLKARSASAAG
jgi:hypothetical protein